MNLGYTEMLSVSTNYLPKIKSIEHFTVSNSNINI